MSENEKSPPAGRQKGKRRTETISGELKLSSYAPLVNLLAAYIPKSQSHNGYTGSMRSSMGSLQELPLFPHKTHKAQAVSRLISGKCPSTERISFSFAVDIRGQSEIKNEKYFTENKKDLR